MERNRHRFRAEWHDYECGAFFVTICTHAREQTLGEITGERMIFSPLGRIVEECIIAIPEHRDDVEILNYVVMPNHVHLVLAVGARYGTAAEVDRPSGCLRRPRHGRECMNYHHNSRLAVIIGSFKAAVTRRARNAGICSERVWQSRYHEHIIRRKDAYEKIMYYVDNNVWAWPRDCFHP